MQRQTLKQSKDVIRAQVTVVILKEGDHFVAYCPALEVSSYGDSEKEAKDAFDEAMGIFLEETTRKGTLEKVLLKLGWVLQQKPKPSYQPPAFSLQDSQRLLRKNPENIYNERVALPFN